MPLLQALGLPAAPEVEAFRARMSLEKEKELKNLRDSAAKQDQLVRKATQDMLTQHLADTGRSRDVSTAPDAATRINEDAVLEKARLAKRNALLAVVYAKTEIGINQLRLADNYATKSPDRATVQGEVEMELNTPQQLAAKKLEVVNLKLVADVTNLADVALKAQDLLDKEIEQRTTDRLSERYADHLAAAIELNLATANKINPTDQDKIAAAQEVMKAEEANLGGLVQAYDGMNLAHYDSRHTSPTTEQQLGRLGSGFSPDLQDANFKTGSRNVTLDSKPYVAPVFAGDTAAGPMSVGPARQRVPANELEEQPGNTISTIENAQAGLFMMEDAMAQAWQQAMLDPDAQQRDELETFYLEYNYAPPRNSATAGTTMDTPLPVGFTEEGMFGKTFKTANPGVAANAFTLNWTHNASANPMSAMNNPHHKFNTKEKIESRLDAAALDKDNKGAKVILHSDQTRGGYQPQTMYSVTADPLTSGATGLKTARRNALGQPVKAVQGADVVALGRPDMANTNWDATAKTRQQKLVDGLAEVRTLAETFKKTFDDDRDAAAVTDQLAAKNLSDHATAQFSGLMPDVVRAITDAAGDLHGAEASLGDLQAQLPLAKDYVTECEARVATMPVWVTAKAKAVTDAHAAADAAFNLDNTNPAKMKARDEALAARDAFKAFQDVLQTRFDDELADARALEVRVNEAIAKADTVHVDAAAALDAKLNAASLATGTADVDDLIAKAKAASKAKTALDVETAKAENAAVAVEAAKRDESAAQEDLKILQDGGYDAFINNRITEEKAARKQQFADVTASGANASDKRALLKGALDLQLADVDDVAKLVEETRQRESDAATAHLQSVKDERSVCVDRDKNAKLGVPKAEADLKVIDDRIAAVNVSLKPLAEQRDEAQLDAADRKNKAAEARTALDSPDRLPANLADLDADQCRLAADEAKERQAKATVDVEIAQKLAEDQNLLLAAAKSKQEELAIQLAENAKLAEALTAFDLQATALAPDLQGLPALSEAVAHSKEAQDEAAKLAGLAKEADAAARLAGEKHDAARHLHDEIKERDAAAAAVSEELSGANLEWNSAAGPLAEANRKLEQASAEETDLEAALAIASEGDAPALAKQLATLREGMEELRKQFDAAEESLSEDARARMEEIEARITVAEDLRAEIQDGLEAAQAQAADLGASLDSIAAEADLAAKDAAEAQTDADEADLRAQQRKGDLAEKVKAAVEAVGQDETKLAAEKEEAEKAEAASRKANEDALTDAKANATEADAEAALALAFEAEARLREADQLLASLEDAVKATADRPAAAGGVTNATAEAEEAKEALEAAERHLQAATALDSIRDDAAKDQEAIDKANTARAKAELALAAAETEHDLGIAADANANDRAIKIAKADAEVETKRALLAETKLELRKAKARLDIAQADRDKAQDAHDKLVLELGVVLPDTPAAAALKKADTLYQNLLGKIVPAVTTRHDALDLANTQREADVAAAEQARALL